MPSKESIYPPANSVSASEKIRIVNIFTKYFFQVREAERHWELTSLRKYKVYHISGTGLAHDEQMNGKVRGQERDWVRCECCLRAVSISGILTCA